MSLPFVSLVTATYNRYPNYGQLLAEAVESFVRQDYPIDSREMIIVNDCPGQHLTCYAKGVRVLNLNKRFDSLGEKLNYGIEQARGQLLMIQDDDDVSLPGRISQAVSKLTGYCDTVTTLLFSAGYFNPRAYFFLSEG